MKRILILGASGFIGQNLVNYFSRFDYKLYGTYLKNKPKLNSKVKYIKIDLKNKKKVSKIIKNIDIVIQSAAVTGGIKDAKNNPAKYIADNAIMNSVIFEAIFYSTVKHLIFLSCSVMYESSYKKLKEKDFNANGNIYPSYFGGAWNKVYFEKMCEYYSRICFTKFTVIRHSNVYGPHDKFDLENSHLCSATIKKVIDNNDKFINVWGNGKEKRDLLFIDDLTRAIKLSIRYQKTKFEIFNIGSGVAISVGKLVKKIIYIADKKIKINFDLTKPTNNFSVSLDSSKAYKILKWKPKYNIDQGLKKTINWYKKNF